MNPLSILQVAELAKAKLEQGDGKKSVERISTDSRTIKEGEIFVALRGENFDGHKFVEATTKAGAAGAIVDLNWKGKVPKKFAIIRADDTLLAYQNLAANYRKSLSTKVLAITGSNGKTSTKDFTASVLGRKFRVTKTQGNFNNHVGLPRTILEATSQDEVAVWEIGMNHPGEVAPRCRAQLPVPGIHMVQNALLAVAAGRAFGLLLEECAAGLVSAPLTKARLQIKEINGVQFLDDSYNANPDSMKAALQTLVELDSDGKRIAVLGEMRELGSETERGHEEVGEAAAAFGIDHLIGIGEMGAVMTRAAEKAGLEKTATVGSASAAAELLLTNTAPG